MTKMFSGPCPVCASTEFSENSVLWPSLINEWQLTGREVDYVNRQQGFQCQKCRNNLRSMGLAAAILRECRFEGTLEEFANSRGDVRILEINTAGNLTPVLSKMSSHHLVEYPQFDMLNLALDSESYDLVIHSDTLEHVEGSERALSECLRVLTKIGVCIFTVPVIVDRLSRLRSGLSPSYHGQSGVAANDQIVWTEFGVDVWKTVLNAGFASCEIFSFEYPAALVMIARKI